MKSQHYTAKGKFTKKMHQGFLLEASEELHSYKKGEKNSSLQHVSDI